MKKDNPNKDRGLRLALQHRNESAERMTPSEDFTERLMKRIERQEEKPKHRRVWLYTAIGAVAASILLLMTIHSKYHHVDIEKGTKISQRTEQQAKQKNPSNSVGKPSSDEQRQRQQAEHQNHLVKDLEGEQAPKMAHNTSGEERATVVSQRPQTVSASHQASADISTTDSLDYYIDKIERELAQVDESLYIERMNKIIRADVRLQSIVNSYILHTLDKDGHPQTADNMYNDNTEQDEE